MAISLARAQAHIAEWTKKASPEWWPQFVYHTADVTVAAQILESGIIVPRSAQDVLVCDVADEQAIQRNLEVHKYCRFYFRPKTLFHIVTEGIRCKTDPKCPKNYMSIPITFLFSAERILTSNGIFYSKSKLADTHPEMGDTEKFFNSINFANVYHNSSTTSDETRHGRMAEVVHYGELPIRGFLQYIQCRTTYERMTLLEHLSPPVREEFANIIRIEKPTGSIFMHSFSLYISVLRFYQGALFFQFNHPDVKGATVPGYDALIRQYANSALVKEQAVQLPRAFNVRVDGFADLPNCYWQIFLEGRLAFQGILPSEETTIV